MVALWRRWWRFGQRSDEISPDLGTNSSARLKSKTRKKSDGGGGDRRDVWRGGGGDRCVCGGVAVLRHGSMEGVVAWQLGRRCGLVAWRFGWRGEGERVIRWGNGDLGFFFFKY